MKLVIGLGNPGKQYLRTRHNAGFLAVDALARALDVSWQKNAARHAQIAKGRIQNVHILLAKPTTFMNLSGDAIQSLMRHTKQEIQNLLIVQDEMDLPPGRIGFKRGGGAAGHNGIASVIERLGTGAFARLRIGIGRPTPPISAEEWVLGKIEPSTRDAIERAPSVIQDWIVLGTERSMNRWNRTYSEQKSTLQDFF